MPLEIPPNQDPEDFINSGGHLAPVIDEIPELEKPPTVPAQLITEKRVEVDHVTESNFFTAQPSQQDGFAFKDPLEMLLILDDDVASGRVALHDWQIQFMLDFAVGGQDDDKPFQALVRACNGSGKDKYVIAPCVVWLCMRYIKARAIVTSASGDQLDNQTDAYINQLCEAANRKIDPKIWKINYRYYECLTTASPIKLFATDEPLKAEGYHPLVADGRMGIFLSEAKSIPDDINTAINKCTGYTHRVHVSTPGLPMGHFFDYCSISVNRKELKTVTECNPIDFIQYHITAFQCSHLSRNYIEQCKRDLPGGELGAAYKSQVLAEFGSTDEMVVIPYTYVWKAVNSAPKEGWLTDPHNKAGLDLSDGGDETVLVVRNGNKVIKVLPFRFDNTEDTIQFLNEKFKEYDLQHPDALVFADCGGLGKPMIDRLKRQGWANMRYVDNRHKAYEWRTYPNRGSEMWFHLRALLERHELIIPRDDKLIRQLATRYYKITQKGTHQLLSKLESRSRGYPSPDRGDAVVLAFCDYKSTFKETKPDKAPFDIPVIATKPIGMFDERVFSKKTVVNPNESLNPSSGRDFRLYKSAIKKYNAGIKN